MGVYTLDACPIGSAYHPKSGDANFEFCQQGTKGENDGEGGEGDVENR